MLKLGWEGIEGGAHMRQSAGTLLRVGLKRILKEHLVKKSNRAMKLLLVTMIFSSMLLYFFASLSNYGALAILLWTSLGCWNVYAFSSNHDMWPFQFVELKASGNVSGRTLVLWVSVGVFFLGLVGIALQSTS
jgi:hypothetical protein